MEEKNDQSIKGPGVLLKNAWGTFIKHPSTYVKLIFLTFVISFVILFVLLVIGIVVYLLSNSFVAAILLTVLIGFPVEIYLQSWFQLALIHALLSDSEGVHKGAIQSLQEVKNKVIPYLLTSLLSGIISFGGFVLFVIPGIIIYIFFSLFPYVMLKEGKRGLRALLGSRDLMKGLTGTIFIYLLIFALISYAVAYIPIYLLEKMELPFLTSIYSLVVSFILGPISALYGIGIYHELKRIRGDVEIKNYEQRKWKYVALGVLGVILPIIAVFIIITRALPIVNELYKNFPPATEEQMDIPSDDTTIYPQPV